MGKKIYLLLVMIILFSCNPLYKKYKRLNDNVPKGKFYTKQLEIIKPILSKEKEDVILIISWEKNILVKNGNVYYNALIYYPSTGEKKLFRTTEKNPRTIVESNNTSDVHFRELVYILDNYLDGKEEYLLSLNDSFSSSELSTPYYVYDFNKNKKIKINSFFFEKSGKIIQ
ncbi:MAG: hypothetical protein BGO86_05045 [Chryseobacterium sp. 36-9]|mgnify:CR=1 FL=1|nr:MAG: hypothetical protein BGO86_05045 [Chryseobacterium sp. 36-9]